MRLDRTHTIDDLHEIARRRLPRVIYDYIDGGAGDEVNLADNRTQFHKYRLVPRYLRDMRGRSLKTSLFGREYGNLFGIAPTGSAGLFRPDGELILARAAVEADIPMLLSTVSVASVEQVAKVAPKNLWFQLYLLREQHMTDDLLQRAADVGVEVAVVTVDTPVPGIRPKDLRNGFRAPLRLTYRMALDGLLHPQWLYGYLRHGGLPYFGNWVKYAPAGSTPEQVTDFMTGGPPRAQTWKDLERYRRNWRGKLILKGILHPDDARQAAELGVDGIIVSNHGGRQIDRFPATLEALPGIIEAVGSRMTVMIDSGFNSGTDIVIAYALGAKYVFTGRATIWGLVAGGDEGIRRAIDILSSQISATMAFAGCNSPAELANATLWRPD